MAAQINTQNSSESLIICNNQFRKLKEKCTIHNRSTQKIQQETFKNYMNKMKNIYINKWKYTIDLNANI